MFAAGYDHVMAAPEKAVLRDHRAALIPRASGSVLEIGGGTGANLPFYGPEIRELVLSEPEPPMAKRLEGKLKQYSLPASVLSVPAEKLPFEDARFDFVISTLVLCTVIDPPRALAEIRRVLKPTGQLLFIEHVRSDAPRLARWQDRLHGLQLRAGHGCHCNRPTLESMQHAGLAISELTRDRMRNAPPIVRPLAVGVAELDSR